MLLDWTTQSQPRTDSLTQPLILQLFSFQFQVEPVVVDNLYTAPLSIAYAEPKPLIPLFVFNLASILLCLLLDNPLLGH